MMRRILLFSLILWAVGTAAADKVVLGGKPAFERVTVTGFAGRRLAFRGLSGETIRRPVGLIERIELDDAPAFSAAEQAAGDKNWDVAKASYERAAREAREPWLRDLARARLLDALERGGRFVDACRVYVAMQRLAQAGAIEPPRMPATAGTDELREAQGVVTEALSVAGIGASGGAALRGLALELIVAIGGEIPADWVPAAVGSSPASIPGTADAETDSDEPPPLMFASDRAGATSGPSASGVQLRAGTPVLGYLASELDRVSATGARRSMAGAMSVRADSLARAMPYFADVDRPQARLLLGRMQIESDRAAEAASGLLALASATADRDLNAAAMYYVGLAHERLGRPEVAADVYRELLGRTDLPAEIRSRAAARATALK